MSMSMDVSFGYGVLFGDAAKVRPREWMTPLPGLVPRPASWPWGDDWDIGPWWKAQGSEYQCPVVRVTGGIDGAEMVGLFLARTASKGFMACKATPVNSDALLAQMEAFLRRAGIDVPAESLGWWAIGDFK